jgi:iron complex outermembrane receptor protein
MMNGRVTRFGIGALAFASANAAQAQTQASSPTAIEESGVKRGDATVAQSGAVPSPTPAAPNSEGIPDIVVTAQKRSESLQKVPLAVTALSGATLQRSGITDLQGATSSIPNLNLGQQVGVAKISLRGIGLESLQPGAEGSIAFYVDGVFISRSIAALASFYDVDQVEVLRGPQGTLYGRNATGGAINIRSRAPTKDTTGYVNLTVGNYNRVVAEGAVSGTIVPDLITARVAFQTQDRSGYGRNIVTGNPIDDLNSRAIRGSLHITPSDRLTLDIVGDYYRQNDNSGGYHYFGGAGFSAPGVPFSPISVTLGGRVPDRIRDIANNTDPLNRVRSWGVHGKFSYEVAPDIELTSLTAYRELSYATKNDIDSTSAQVGNLYQGEQDWQFSQEFQLAGHNDRLNWLIGGFYFRENDRGQLAIPFDNLIVGIPSPNAFVRGYYGGGYIKTDALAGFGQASYEIIDHVRLTLGARYSTEKKTNRDESAFDVFTPFDPGAPIRETLATPAGAASIVRDKRFNSFTPKVALDYQVTRDVLLYASWSKGFKSGTYSLGSFTPPVNPEKVSAFEGGIKSSLFNRRVRLNIAGFYYDYTDLQIGKVVDTLTILENAATAKIYGVEAELQANVTDRFEIDGNASWLHARFDNYVSADPARPFGDGRTVDDRGQQAFDLSGNTLSQSPNFSFQAGAQYSLPSNIGDFVLRGEVAYRSRSYFTPFNLDYISQKSFAKVNLFLNWESRNQALTASVFVKNLTNQTTVGSAYVNSVIFGVPINGYLEEPRTYGVRLGYKF